MQIEYAKVSALGDRQDNQDRAAVVVSEDAALMLVFDGMGGHSDGAKAAETGLKVVQDLFMAAPQPIFDPQGFLYMALSKAHDEVVTLGTDVAVDFRPRATCAVCLVQEGGAFWAHIGDSRLYQFRKGDVLARTEDHTVGQLMLAQGGTGGSNQDAKGLEQKLYMRLGGDTPPEPEFGATEASCGDVFLICSDGFWATVRPDEVVDALNDRPLDAGGVDRLMSLARGRAGKDGDNISFALARWSLEPRARVQRFVSRLMSGIG